MSDSRVIITADADRAISEFRRFRQQAVGALEQVSEAGGVIGGLLGAIGLSLSVAAFTGWIKGAIDATDAASDLSQRIGVAVEDLAGLELAFQMGGMEAGALEGSMAKLSKQIVDGNDAFTKLGLSSKNLDGSFKSNKDMLYELADRFASMEEGVEKVALAQEVFGKSGAAMLPLLNGGAEGLREMDAMARQLGLSLSEDAVEKAGEFNDTLDLLALGTQGVARGVAAELLPTLSNLAGQFLTTMTQGDSLRKTAEFLATGLKLLYTVGVGIVEVFSTVGKTIGAAGAQLVALLQGDFKIAAEIGRQWQADIGSSWAETARSIAAAWDTSGNASVQQMASIVRHGTVVGQSAAEIAAETKKLNQEQQAQAKLLAELSGLSGTFAQEWDALSSAYASGALSVDALTTAQAKLLAKQPAIKAANDAAAKAVADELKIRDEATAAVDRDVDAIIKQTEALELKIRTYGMLPDAITEVQIAELEASKQSLVLTDAGVADIQRRIDALRELKAAQSNSQAQDAAAEATKKVLADQVGLWGSLEETAHDTFISIFDSGKSTLDRLTDTLKNGLYELLYQMTAKKWIINISSQVNGQGGLSQLGDALGASSGSGSGIFGNASSLISMGKTIYSGFTGGIASTLGGWASSAGSLFGSSAVSSFGAGLSAAGGNTGMAAMYASAQTSGNLAAGASAGMSAGTYAIPIAGWIAAGMALSNNLYKQGWDANNGTVNTLGKTVNGGMFIANDLLKGLGMSNSAANILAGMGPISKLFGRKNPEVEESGVRGSVSAGGFAGENYANILEKGGWFRSSKRYVQTSPLSADQQSGFSDSAKSMMDAARGFAATLGIEASVIDGYNKQITLQLGADEEKNKEAIAKLFGGIGDDLSLLILPSVASFSVAGESVSATLQRLVTDYAVIDEALGAIGSSFGAEGVSSLAAREQLLAAAGGVEAFATNAAFFHQTFLSEAERNAPVLAAVTEQMAALGLAAVDTRDEFKQAVLDLVDSGALATETGAKRYAELMKVQGAFAQVYPAIDATGEAASKAAAELRERVDLQKELDDLTLSAADKLARQRDALHESNRALFDQVQAIKAQSAAAEEAAKAVALAAEAAALAAAQAIEFTKDSAAGLLAGVDSAYAALQSMVERQKRALQQDIQLRTESLNERRNMANALRNTIEGMRTPEQQEADRWNAMEAVRAALAIAKAGGLMPDPDMIQKALARIGNGPSTDGYSTYQDYMRDLNGAQGDLAELASLTDDALSIDEKSLKALQDQIQSLDLMLDREQEQIDVLKGISTTGLSIVQLLEALRSAMLAAGANPLNSTMAAVNEAYKSALGRTPDAAGLEFWRDRAAEGVSQDAIIDAIKGSPEAQIQRLYKEVLGRSNDGAGMQFWLKQLQSGVSIEAIRDAMMSSDEAKMKIPGFATGGDFAGGWRIVGERGPELEATGAARIFNAGQTQNIMRSLSSPSENSTVLVAEIRLLRSEVERLTAAARSTAAATERTANSTEQFAEQFDEVTDGANMMRVEVFNNGR